MMYRKRTIDFVLYYEGNHDYKLYGYTDAYLDGSISDRKSTLGGFFCLGSAMISWFSKKQSSISLSMTEAKYIADCSAKL